MRAYINAIVKKCVGCFVFRFCKRNALDTGIINGNVVVCFMENPGDNMLEKSSVVSDGGGVGMIVVDLHNDYDKGKGDYYPIPTSVINQDGADKLGNYIASFRYSKIVVLYFSLCMHILIGFTMLNIGKVLVLNLITSIILSM